MRKNIVLLCLLFACFQSYCQEFAVEIKMKPQENKDYAIAKDIKMQSLSAKHNCTLRQSYPGAKTPELLLYYTLTGNYNKDIVIKLLCQNKF